MALALAVGFLGLWVLGFQGRSPPFCSRDQETLQGQVFSLGHRQIQMTWRGENKVQPACAAEGVVAEEQIISTSSGHVWRAVVLVPSHAMQGCGLHSHHAVYLSAVLLPIDHV